MKPDVRFVPLTPELLAGAVLEERDGLTAELAQHPGFAARLLMPPAITGAMLGRGRVLAAGGLIPWWHGRAEAWLMLSLQATARERALAIWRVKQQIDQAQRSAAFRRIELYVRANEPWVWRFTQLLGFRIEGELTAWDPWGRDYRLFARVKRA